MSYIWSISLLASLVCGLLNGTAGALAAALLQGAQEGVQLCMKLAGSICLWSAVARVMDKAALNLRLARLFHPALSRLFPKTCRDEEGLCYLSENFTANLLGLGNAATPAGLRCVQRMQALESGSRRASNEMCRLIVLNTASITLLPTTVCSLRAQLGADSPFEILPAVWLSSILSLAVGLLACAVMETRHV